MATYSDDEGDDERDKSASADDEMAFIDDAFFELPDVATEEEAEGGGSQSQYSQQSQGGESEGSQSSQGSQRARARRERRNQLAAQRFMDRIRFELRLGHRGTESSQARAGQDNDDSDDGARSDDEETPDRAAEPGPSEQPPETGQPNDGSQTDDEFTVMDVDEEQPEHEASQPPRKRGRFENERSDSMSQGEGASQQHDEGEELMTPKQKMRQRKRMDGPARKPRDDFRRRRADQPY